MGSNSEKRWKRRKTEDLDSGMDMRMGYHSEKASPEDPGRDGGMRMGYHSEKANPPQEESVGGGSGGMRMGYHSEKANSSKHSKRLHKKSKKN
ncbi:MAG TPA: hypothetical protein VE544_11450 [Nitrososphaeraceae archaeon]|nr:hypothetical protein [Nitrososphaeraceae archaeon]